MTITIENATVRLVDLVGPLGMEIVDLVAKNVTFIGPAVAFLRGDIEIHGANRVTNSVESILWDIDPARTEITGAVVISGARFENCTFHMIGFSASTGMMSELVAGLTVAPVDGDE